VEVPDPVEPERAGGKKVDVGQGVRNRRVSSEWPSAEKHLRLRARGHAGCQRKTKQDARFDMEGRAKKLLDRVG
jgi:hypothetical protein